MPKAESKKKNKPAQQPEKKKISGKKEPKSVAKASKKRVLEASLPDRSSQKATVLSSGLSYEGPLFKVFTEQVREPGGKEARRDIIRHNGSVVILAADTSKSRKDPLIIMEQQYRHAAGQYLIELPAGKLEAGEDPMEGAQRELIEETGYRARKWSKLVRYFASPGFLGEWMQVFLAEDLTLGKSAPEEDEHIDVAAIPLSKLLKMIDKGKILDGKTLVGVTTYARKLRGR